MAPVRSFSIYFWIVWLAPSLLHVKEASNCDSCQQSQCGLWLARTFDNMLLSLYTGVDRVAGDSIGEARFIIPLMEDYKYQWCPWQASGWEPDVLHGFLSEFFFRIYLPGAGCLGHCSEQRPNIKAGQKFKIDDNIHRSSHSTAGSFNY